MKHPLLILPALAAFDLSALAQATWDGGGADALWSNPLNWVGDIAPASFSPLTFEGTVNLTPLNDIPTFSATGITFGPAAGPFVLGGEGIFLSGNVTNSTALDQKLNFNFINLAGNTTIDTGAGTISSSAAWSANGGSLVTKNGSGTLKYTNTGAITIADAGGGAFTLNQGNVLFDGGDQAVYTVNGETWFGSVADQNTVATVNSGSRDHDLACGGSRQWDGQHIL